MSGDFRSHAARGAARSIPGLTAALHRAQTALAVRRSRLALARLDMDGLRDIGISQKQADAESCRSMWDAPGFGGTN